MKSETLYVIQKGSRRAEVVDAKGNPIANVLEARLIFTPMGEQVEAHFVSQGLSSDSQNTKTHQVVISNVVAANEEIRFAFTAPSELVDEGR